MDKRKAMQSFTYWGDRIYTLTGRKDKKAEIMRALWAKAIDSGLYRKLPNDPVEADDELWKMYKEGRIDVSDLVEESVTKKHSAGGRGMSKAVKLLEQLDSLLPYTEDEVTAAFTEKLKELGIENVTVTDVNVGYEGNVLVEFADDEGDAVTVLFGYDLQDGPYAMVVSDDDEQVVIDLSPLSPPIVGTQTGTYVDLSNLDWVNLSMIKTLLQAGEVGTSESFNLDKVDAIDEVVYKKVIRQGKVVKIPVVKRRRKRHLTPAQKRALALARRKAHTAQAKRKRALSLKMRKRMGLDRQ